MYPPLALFTGESIWMDTKTGFVALLDVLGFKSLVSGGNPTRLQRYLECLQTTLRSSEQVLDYVVFSDSIVLTTRDASEDSLQVMLCQCSQLFGVMLKEEIPLRGAIACGPFVREESKGGVFIAGNAIIDAYAFETAQDWVGVMLTPSAHRRVPTLKDRCRLSNFETPDGLKALEDRMGWAAHVQPCASIPFHCTTPFEDSQYDGFAIVPASNSAGPVHMPVLMERSLKESLAALDWLKSLAPNPAAQAKYKRARDWLYHIHQSWWGIDQYSQRYGRPRV
jgi:hypothetical protein